MTSNKYSLIPSDVQKAMRDHNFAVVAWDFILPIIQANMEADREASKLENPVYKPGTPAIQIIEDGFYRGFHVDQTMAELRASGYDYQNSTIDRIWNLLQIDEETNHRKDFSNSYHEAVKKECASYKVTVSEDANKTLRDLLDKTFDDGKQSTFTKTTNEWYQGIKVVFENHAVDFEVIWERYRGSYSGVEFVNKVATDLYAAAWHNGLNTAKSNIALLKAFLDQMAIVDMNYDHSITAAENVTRTFIAYRNIAIDPKVSGEASKLVKDGYNSGYDDGKQYAYTESALKSKSALCILNRNHKSQLERIVRMIESDMDEVDIMQLKFDKIEKVLVTNQKDKSNE